MGIFPKDGTEELHGFGRIGVFFIGKTVSPIGIRQCLQYFGMHSGVVVTPKARFHYSAMRSW